MVVLGINLRETVASVKPWANAKKLTYTILLDQQAAVWSKYSMGYIPHNVVLDSTYVVRYADYGYNQNEIIGKIQEFLPSETKVKETSIPNNLNLIASYPNPFKDHTKIIVNLTKNESYDLKIYDIFGRLVSTVTENSISNKSGTQLWNRRNDYGKKMASGVYFAVLTTSTIRTSIKLLVLN